MSDALMSAYTDISLQHISHAEDEMMIKFFPLIDSAFFLNLF